jgi:hypothetical protein
MTLLLDRNIGWLKKTMMRIVVNWKVALKKKITVVVVTIVTVIKGGDNIGMVAFTRKNRVKRQVGGNCIPCYVVVGLLGLVYYFDKSDFLFSSKNKK